MLAGIENEESAGGDGILYKDVWMGIAAVQAVSNGVQRNRHERRFFRRNDGDGRELATRIAVTLGNLHRGRKYR